MWNRREFLTQMSLVVMLPRGLAAQESQTATSKVGTDLSPDHLQVLAAAMDEIIPKGDGMRSATDAGGLEYLQYLGWQYQNIEREMAAFLEKIQQAASARFGKDFTVCNMSSVFNCLQTLKRIVHPALRALSAMSMKRITRAHESRVPSHGQSHQLSLVSSNCSSLRFET